MKNVLKLIIDAIKIAISKISWNDLNDKPFYEEVDKNIIVPELTLENFEVLEDPIYVVVNQFTMTPIVGDTYTVNWDGNSYDVVAKELDGLVCIGNENYVDVSSGGKIPFAIIFTDTDIFVAIESTETSYTEETHTISIFTTQTNIKKIDEKYLPDMGAKSWNDLEDRPFYDDYTALSNSYLDLDEQGNINDYYMTEMVYYNKEYLVLFDNVEYKTAWGKAYIAGSNCRYLGAVPNNITEDLPFSLSTYTSSFPFTAKLNISTYDGEYTHDIKIVERDLKQLNPKYLKDMYYEEKDYTAVLSYTPSVFSDHTLSYNCTADEIASFRELLDNNSEITVGIGETFYTLEFRGMSSGYYELYYNDFLVFEYYMGNTNRQINFYYKNLGLSSTPEGIEITFYKQDTLIHKIDKKYLPDDIGGASVFTVNITVNEDGSYSADKTFDEIKAAHESGKVVMASCMDALSPCMSITEEYIGFELISVYETGVCGEKLYMLQDNTIEYIREEQLIGNINNLTTTDKYIVGAINELNAKHTEGTDSLTLLSPNGTRFSITVGDDGVLSANEIII